MSSFCPCVTLNLSAYGSLSSGQYCMPLPQWHRDTFSTFNAVIKVIQSLVERNKNTPRMNPSRFYGRKVCSSSCSCQCVCMRMVSVKLLLLSGPRLDPAGSAEKPKVWTHISISAFDKHPVQVDHMGGARKRSETKRSKRDSLSAVWVTVCVQVCGVCMWTKQCVWKTLIGGIETHVLKHSSFDIPAIFEWAACSHN